MRQPMKTMARVVEPRNPPISGRGPGSSPAALVPIGARAPATTWADDDPRRSDGYPATYAIKDARIVTAPGRATMPGPSWFDEVDRSGRGRPRKRAVPFDAEVIDGKGLIVYPGFIDLFRRSGKGQELIDHERVRGKHVDLAESRLATTPPTTARG